MKSFILYVLIPCKLFSCQECIIQVQDKIDNISMQLMHAECCEKLNAYDIYFLFGQLDAYYNSLRILENHNH